MVSSEETSETEGEEDMIEETEDSQLPTLSYLKVFHRKHSQNLRPVISTGTVSLVFIGQEVANSFQNQQNPILAQQNSFSSTNGYFSLADFLTIIAATSDSDTTEDDKIITEILECFDSCKMLHSRGQWQRALDYCSKIYRAMVNSKRCSSVFSTLLESLSRQLKLESSSEFSCNVMKIKKEVELDSFKLRGNMFSTGEKPSIFLNGKMKRWLEEWKPLALTVDKDTEPILSVLTECCTMTGSCLYKLRHYYEAFDWYQISCMLDANDIKALCGLSAVIREIAPDHITEALSYLRKAYSLKSSDLETAHMLASFLVDIGVRLKLAGLSKEAISYYQEAISVYPTFAQAYYNLGVTYADLGNFDEALKFYMEAIHHHPHHTEAYCNAGVIYKEKGDLMKAIEKYNCSLETNPNFELARNNLAIAYSDLGTVWKTKADLEKSIYYYKKSLALHPAYSDAHYNLGVAYSEARKFERAITHYELAVRFNPSHTESFNNLGVLYKEMGNLEKAIASYKAALNINPQYFQTHNNLAVVYTIIGACDLAKEHLRLAISLNPSYAEAHNNLGVLLRDEGDIHGSIQHYEHCLQIDPRANMTAQNRLHALNYADEYDVDYIYEEHDKWGKKFLKHVQQEIDEAAKQGNEIAKKLLRPLIPDRIPRGPCRHLRVGYISPDFFTHSVSYFIEAPLYYHDTGKIDVYIYSNVSKPDRKTALFKSFESVKMHWREITGESTLSVCDKILKDEIDILVELAGHTAGNRLDVMAAKPAPVQITWIGYPNTTGLKTVDYRLTDRTVDPEDTTQTFTEHLWRLSKCFLCYTPSVDAPPCSFTIPAKKSGQCITFGSFNVLAKIQANAIAVWAHILRSVPNSRLLLKAKPFASSVCKGRFENVFEAVGVSADRLDLLPLLPETRNHLETYSLVDICLDPFPYAGTTTTCEALYMGVPVITLTKAGRNHAHSVGETLLKSIGHAELIASSEEEYINIAISLANDMERLEHLRRNLRNDMLASSLCQGTSFVKELEDAYYHIWKEKGGVIKDD
eukprot:jgi/Galph1/6124/GphlegSOOS_G4657.1